MKHLLFRVAIFIGLLVSGNCSSDHQTKEDASTDAGMTMSTHDGAVGIDAARRDTSSIEAAIDSGVDSNPDRDSATVLDAQSETTRGYYLASTGAQLLVSGPRLGLQLTEADLAQDVDIVAVHQEFYGIPWEAFENAQAPPAEWEALMKELAESAHAMDKPIFLSVTMLNGVRDSLAARTEVTNSKIETQDHWAARCYDFAAALDAQEKKAAYLRYLEYMIDRFQPHYLAVAVEINLFMEKCPGAIDGLIKLTNEAYDTAKRISPDAVVFPTIQIDHLYGVAEDSCPNESDRESCFDAAYQQIAPLKRDRFAISTYPFLQQFGDPASLPDDWFTRGAERAQERAIIAETGWLSSNLVGLLSNGECRTVIRTDQTRAAAYLDRVLDSAEQAHMDLVTWWSNRDLLDERVMTSCPCTVDTNWCAVVEIFRNAAPLGGDTEAAFYGEVLFKAFGAMGIRDYLGNPKEPLYEHWIQAVERTPNVLD